jgi:DNA-binding transcriptional regulator GbsR (MarR family)
MDINIEQEIDPAVFATDERAGRLEQLVLKVSDNAGTFVEYWGYKAIHGRIWAYVALHQAPMNQIDIAHGLGVSRSLVSGAMGELVDFGLVRATGDHRNAPYEATMDVWPVISDVLRSREWMLLERARLSMEAALEEAKLLVARGVEIPYNLERLRLLLNMTQMAQSFLKMLMSIRVARGLEGLGGWMARASSLVKKIRRQG